MAEATFSIYDYIVFCLFLCISLFVGIYHAWKSRKIERNRPTESQATLEFLMGSRKMPVVPVCLSLLTTFLSGVSLLGTPAEIYQRGALFWIYYCMGATAFIVSGLFFLPIFYKLQPVSIYSYFERRFGSGALRMVAASLFLVHSLFYMAVVLYSPAVALAKVTDTPEWPWIMVIGLVCSAYSSLGGLKAVVWTDTLQAAFMYLGVALMIVKGTLDAGGWDRVWQVARDTGRLESLTNWDWNPVQHNTGWASTFGAFGLWMGLYGLNQMSVQRIALALTVPCFVVLASTACFIGLVMLAYFYGECDPMDLGMKPDQMVVLFAVRTLRSIPGLPGLFLACLFSSTLSTISSGINSQAAVLWEDFLKGLMGHRVNDQRSALINRCLVLCFGLIATGLAFTTGPIGGIIKSAFSLLGALSGPLTGLFFLGVFVPRAHTLGAVLGLIVSCIPTMALAFGNLLLKPYKLYRLPANDTCRDYSKVPDWALPSSLLNDTGSIAQYGDPSVWWPFRTSIYFYSLIGILTTFTFGTIFSYVIQKKEKNPKTSAEQYGLTFFGHNWPRTDEMTENNGHWPRTDEMTENNRHWPRTDEMTENNGHWPRTDEMTENNGHGLQMHKF